MTKLDRLKTQKAKYESAMRAQRAAAPCRDKTPGVKPETGTCPRCGAGPQQPCKETTQ